MDSSDSALLSLLDADVLLTLAPTADPSRGQVTISERDFGVLGSVYLQPDLLHARFVDIPDSSVTDPAVVELADAALPYASGAERGLPASLTHTLAALRTAVVSGDDEAVAEVKAALDDEARSVSLPDTDQGRRLAAALQAFPQPVSEGTGGTVFSNGGEGTPEIRAKYARIIAEVRAGHESSTATADEPDAEDEQAERTGSNRGMSRTNPRARSSRACGSSKTRSAARRCTRSPSSAPKTATAPHGR
ncbi:hypothetical protein ACFV2H_47665 [Streptomyces sp. NPDC059629]|uniref:hypothetical protein n=1 Tax=Streptomyces sp. NPDC059629 TaxID=3346889 RepID=UPI0036A0D58D